MATIATAGRVDHGTLPTQPRLGSAIIGLAQANVYPVHAIGRMPGRSNTGRCRITYDAKHSPLHRNRRMPNTRDAADNDCVATLDAPTKVSPTTTMIEPTMQMHTPNIFCHDL